MIATQRRALIAEILGRRSSAVELIEGGSGRGSDALSRADQLTITVVRP
jgi:hypothetical protein